MKRKKVYLLSGPSGAGKSTWVRNNLAVGSEWISRDNVRFSIVSEDEQYFSHEEEVFDTFIAYINQTLENPDIHTIYIDATHLTKVSRYKTLSRIRKDNIEELNCVSFTTPKALCKSRNNLRTGRKRVPETVIDNMFRSYNFPIPEEGFDHTYRVDENGTIKEV